MVFSMFNVVLASPYMSAVLFLSPGLITNYAYNAQHKEYKSKNST